MIRFLPGFISMVMFCISLTICGQETMVKLQFELSVAAPLHDRWHPQGRVLIFLTEMEGIEPRTLTWPSKGNHILAMNLNDWKPNETRMFTAGHQMISTKYPLDRFPSGEYYLQALWDQDQQESRIDAPGNLFSEVKKVVIRQDQTIRLVIDQIIPPRRLIVHPLVHEITFKSAVLSAWWKKDVYLKASVLVPVSYVREPKKKYPLRINVSGYGGRYTRVNGTVQDSAFMAWYSGPDGPDVITLYVDGEGPFGDCYQLDSENSGPYGTALTSELIPYIEKTFRARGNANSRYVDGCSTGGWVSLALQLLYPDYFNGAFSYSPDAVDFENWQLINIYQDKNAFINEYGLSRPLAREVSGEPIMTMQEFIQYENVLAPTNTYVTSGGQFSAFTALYSPKGADGLPVPLFDPYTGVINQNVAKVWKYDLKRYVQNNWPVLGPKLQGKLWIWMGDMDNFYLNPALRSLEAFLKSSTNPVSDVIIQFSPMCGHCDHYSEKKVLQMIQQKELK